jgi:hydrogenase expression/formation protein HypC
MCLAVPGKITEIYEMGEMHMCKVDFGGVTREACIQALPEAKLGDYVIVHAGFALSILSEQEAQETLDILSELSMVEEEMDNEQAG